MNPYDVTPPDKWVHRIAVRGCHPDCGACAHEAEMAERAAS